MSRFPGDFMSTRKSIFITGAASGIGLATAKLFAKKGWFVGLADINAAGLKAALDAIGRENGAISLLDVRDRAAWDDALSVFTTAAGGKLDVLLNNAGVVAGGYFDELSEADIDRQLDINLKGVINGARAGLGYLKKNPARSSSTLRPAPRSMVRHKPRSTVRRNSPCAVCRNRSRPSSRVSASA